KFPLAVNTVLPPEPESEVSKLHRACFESGIHFQCAIGALVLLAWRFAAFPPKSIVGMLSARDAEQPPHPSASGQQYQNPLLAELPNKPKPTEPRPRSLPSR